MSNLAINVHKIGKSYRIGTKRNYSRLSERLSQAAEEWLGFRKRPATNEAAAETFWALKDVSIQVRHGEVVGLIGRNGAGKSTLLKILSRVTEPTEGYCEMFGRVGSLLEVGVGFHPELSGRENIYLSGAILGMKREEVKRDFDAIVDFAGVERFIDTPVKRYSSGMYVRLAFAVAAHLEPEILIVDEVLAVGDAAFQKKCLSKMGDVSSSGRTVLFVSHNMSAISSLCTTAIYMSDGMVKSSGPADEIVSDYLNELFEDKSPDLASFRQSGMGREIRFIQAEVENASGIGVGQPIKFKSTVESDIDIEDLSICATLLDSSGSPIGTFFTPESFSLKRGTQVCLSVELRSHNLVPGRYHCIFCAGKPGLKEPWECHDILLGRPVFQISAAIKETSMLVNWNSGNWGHIYLEDVRLLKV